MQYLKAIKIIFKILFSIKDFKFPKKNKILVIDEVTGRKLFKYLNNNYSVLHSRMEKVNIFVLLLTVIDLIFKNKLRFNQYYFLNFIKSVNPKIVITSNDFDRNVWNLKKYYPKIKILIIQNNIRNGWSLGSLHLKTNKKYNIDYCFTFGKNFSNYYKKNFNAKFIELGSIYNNETNIKPVNKKGLVYISQFKNWKKNDITKSDNGGKINLFNSYFESDSLIIQRCIDFCKKNKIKFYILFRTNDERISLEEKYYDKILKNEKVFYLKQKRKEDNYKIANKFKYFISIDSTFAYECLAKFKRVGYINFRYSMSNFHNGKNHRYGWPSKLKKKGFFWTNSKSKNEINRILNNIYFCKDKKWKYEKEKYVNPIIHFDNKNKQLKEIILKLL
tara:strand:+ start:272 stop:1438 length:1167 start_codon:yes stop_codon:yes gene_type:complete